MRKSSFLGVCLIVVTVVVPSFSYAEDISALRSAISGWHRSQLCPSKGQYIRISDKECDKHLNKCGNDYGNECYNSSMQSFHECEKSVADQNKIIDEYNEIERQCNRTTDNKPGTTPTNWMSRLKAAHERNKAAESSASSNLERAARNGKAYLAGNNSETSTTSTGPPEQVRQLKPQEEQLHEITAVEANTCTHPWYLRCMRQESSGCRDDGSGDMKTCCNEFLKDNWGMKPCL
jgi:hypothetical protein